MPYQDYLAPTEELKHWINHVHGIDELCELEKFKDFSSDIASAVIDEGAKFAQQVLAPLNAVGDKEGAVRTEDGRVTMPAGFKQAYHDFMQAGWGSVRASTEYGGQAMPEMVVSALAEMWNSANMAFALCPMLTESAIELLEKHGSDAQKSYYLTKLITGEWTGTMCLTEPQAGSDVGALTTQALPEKKHYRIKGTKIYITYGEHNLTDNIIHMVLARLPDAPSGSKGISLFIVPKYLEDGSRNAVTCLSLEHKLGIHASPTAVMEFGNNQEGAIGYLVGSENGGLKSMFTMMNHARLAVGIEGIGIAEAVYQQASAYAKERKQGGKIIDGIYREVTIDQYPDVKRMLQDTKARLDAMRGLALYIAKHADIANTHSNEQVQKQSQHIVEFLTPVLKSAASEEGFNAASEAMQIFGGMGYIEETGVAQYMRDSRIAMIYEGANGIQAMDLVMRKMQMDAGALLHSVVADIEKAMPFYKNSIELQAFKESFGLFKEAAHHILQLLEKNAETAAFHAMPFLRLCALVTGGFMMVKLFYNEKSQAIHKKTASYYLRIILTDCHGLHKRCMIGNLEY